MEHKHLQFNILTNLKKDKSTNGKKVARENKQVMAHMKLNNYILYSAATANLSYPTCYKPMSVFYSEYRYTALDRTNLYSRIPDALEERITYIAFLTAAGSLAHSCRSHCILA